LYTHAIRVCSEESQLTKTQSAIHKGWMMVATQHDLAK